MDKLSGIELDYTHALGSAIRHFRNKRNLTMEQLGRDADLSIAMISKIESGNGNPSIGSLRRIALALDVPITVLLAQEDAGGVEQEVFVNHKRIYSNGGATYTILAAPPAANATLIFLEALPGARMGMGGARHLPHEAHEQALVLEGILTCTIGSQTVELGPGESISYPSTLHHFWENLGTKIVKAVWVVSGAQGGAGELTSARIPGF